MTLVGADQKRELGGKASSLAWLRRGGFPVPAFEVLPADLLTEFLARHELSVPALADGTGLAALREALIALPWPADMEQRLRQALDEPFGRSPAVARSSASLEDLEAASFAGLYESVLDLRGTDEILRGVRVCWASLYGTRVTEYLTHRGIGARDLAMAVIVQRMVPAVCAGVAFSIHPVTGADDEVMIEATAGLADALVSGQVQPERVRYAWKEGRERERQALPGGGILLTPELVAEIAETVVAVQALRGRPVDVEWAHDGERLWLVQERPITSIGNAAYPGEWTTADMKDGGVSAGVCTPFMADLYRQAFVGSVVPYFDSVGLTVREPETQPWYCVAFGRPYWNAGLTKARLAQLPGFKERQFDEGLGIQPAYAGDGIVTKLTPRSLLRGLLVLGRMRKSFAQRLQRIEATSRAFDALLRRWEAIAPAALADDEWLERWSELVRKDYLQVECDYFSTIYDNSNAQTLFQDRLAALRKRHGGALGFEPLALLGGLQDLSHLRPAKEEAELAAALAARPAVVTALLATSSRELADLHRSGSEYPGADLIHPHLSRWWWLTPRTLEILEPRWDEDPEPFFASLLRALALGGVGSQRSVSEAEIEQRAAFEAARARVLQRMRSRFPGLARRRRAAFCHELETTRSLMWWREELRAHSTRMYALIRRWTLDGGRRLTASAVLARLDDIFFLTPDEIHDAARGHLLPQQAKERVRLHRLHYDGFREFPNPSEMGARWLAQDAPAVESSSRVLRGIAGSAGRYTGTARVITSVAELAALRSGEVLVTRFTDPGWTSAFAMLGAVVTETGGVLSHAAVISREYGLPAVLALPRATELIADGEQVCVDGDAGTVTRLAGDRQ